MKVNKIYRIALIAAALVALPACQDKENDPDGPETPEETETPGEVDGPADKHPFAGAYVINQGSYFLQIEGALSEINFVENQCTPDVFVEANRRSLGNTPQTGALYGSHIYVGVYGSNTIEVINRYTYKSEKQISLANAEGQEPRSMVAYKGKVYISMFNGYVSRLDTTSLEIDAVVKVGPNPETIARRGNFLYVPNSDGMNSENGYGRTASKIDLTNFSVVKTFEVGVNPTQFASNGKDLFLMCAGDYYLTPSAVYRVNDDDALEEIESATMISVDGASLYMINAPYGVAEQTYRRYDIKDRKISDMSLSELPAAPVSISSVAATGELLIGSNVIDGGKPSYTLPGVVMRYSDSGKLLNTYSVGVYPSYMFSETIDPQD